MARGKRRAAAVAGRREAAAIAANLGRDLKATRSRRRLTQAALATLVDLSQSEISYLERGFGARVALETWVAIGIALERPISVGFSRDVVQPLSDAGHLAAQELVARIAGTAGWRIRFEASDHGRAAVGSTDLALERDDELVLVEIWNRVDDLGAAVRSTDRKLAAARVGARSVWLLVDTAANRAVVRTFPTLIRTRFPGSSQEWVAALAARAKPPEKPGIGWVDVRAGRLRELRAHSRGR